MRIKSIEILEKAKDDIIAEIEQETANYYIPEEDQSQPDNENYQKCRIIVKRLAKEKEVVPPTFIRDCRTIFEVVDFLMHDSTQGSIPAMNSHVSRSLNEYIDYLEDEQIDVKIMHVKATVPEKLTYSTILESIEKCENRINTGDYSGAVTIAKTLVEGVCKEILENFPQVEVKKNIKLPALFSLVRDNLSLNPGDPKLDNSLKQVITGLNSIVNGISEVRNSHGDSHPSTDKLKEHHALVVVNSAKTVVNFLFGTYSYQLEKGTLVVS
jgi:Abortive infection C-terminus